MEKERKKTGNETKRDSSKEKKKCWLIRASKMKGEHLYVSELFKWDQLINITDMAVFDLIGTLADGASTQNGGCRLS